MIGPQRLLRFKLGKTAADRDRLVAFLVRTARENVPYYRHLMDEAGIDPRGVQSVAGLSRLPVTTKDALLDSHQEGFLHRRAVPDRCWLASTSGYTGAPLTVYSSGPEAYFRRMALLLSLHRGARLSWPVTLLYVGAAPRAGRRDMVQRLGLVRVTRISRDLPVIQQVAGLRAVHAQVIEGMPSYLELLAQEVADQGVRVPQPRLVATLGEMLHPHQEKLLEEVFHAPVASYYNCEEIGNVAWPCPKDRTVLHVNTDTCILEVADERGTPVAPGEEGRVLLTSLFGLTMPLLRYDVGDRARLLGPNREPCACGYVGDSISLEVARDEDFLRSPDGERISPRRAVAAVLGAALGTQGLTDAFADVLRRFQIVQETVDRVVVRAVRGPESRDGIAADIAARFAAIHPGLHCRVEWVDALEFEPSGKLKKVVCQVERRGGSMPAVEEGQA